MPDKMLNRSILNTSFEVDENTGEFYNVNNMKLNVGQQEQFNRVVHLINKDEGGLINFDAPGGSGKTFLAEVILAYVQKNNKIAVATAISGIAATLLPLGTMCHKRFGVPVPCTANRSSK